MGSVSTGGGSCRGDEEGKISGERGVGKQKKKLRKIRTAYALYLPPCGSSSKYACCDLRLEMRKVPLIHSSRIVVDALQ